MGVRNYHTQVNTLYGTHYADYMTGTKLGNLKERKGLKFMGIKKFMKNRSAVRTSQNLR